MLSKGISYSEDIYLTCYVRHMHEMEGKHRVPQAQVFSEERIAMNT